MGVCIEKMWVHLSNYKILLQFSSFFLTNQTRYQKVEHDVDVVKSFLTDTMTTL